jgi:exonuclease III
VSWNVAGFASILSKGFLDYVKNEDPDILCVQETKIEPSKVKADLISGYHQHFYAAEKKGYSGTG